jgi:polysaccharide pyruvyl transferase WcaK-like protein
MLDGVVHFGLRRPKVLLVVCLYENNFGDVLIYDTVDRNLQDAGFETEIIHVHQSLNESKLIERANNSDFLCFAGGGLIERGAPPVIRNFEFVYQHLKVPYGVLGLSVGEFDYSSFANSLRLFSENAVFFYTRDRESVGVFEKFGSSKLPTARVDVVFANKTLELYRAEPKIITASFRNVPYVDVTGDLNWQRWSAVLRTVGVSSLIPDCSRAQSQLGIPIANGDILQQISLSKVVVAMRYHIILAAAVMGIPVIPITYCPKVGRLAEQLGIGKYCLGIHQHDKLRIVFDQLCSEAKSVKQILRTRVDGLKKQANQMFTDVTKKIVANTLVDVR